MHAENWCFCLHYLHSYIHIISPPLGIVKYAEDKAKTAGKPTLYMRLYNLASKKTPFCRKQKGLVLTFERVRDSIQLFVVSDEDEPPVPPEIRLAFIGRHATIDGFLLVIHREKFLRAPSLEIGANGEDIQVVRYHEDGLPGKIPNQSTEEVTVIARTSGTFSPCAKRYQ